MRKKLKGNVKSRLREAFTGATNESMQRLGKRSERKGFEQEWNISTTRDRKDNKYQRTSRKLDNKVFSRQNASISPERF